MDIMESVGSDLELDDILKSESAAVEYELAVKRGNLVKVQPDALCKWDSEKVNDFSKIRKHKVCSIAIASPRRIYKIMDSASEIWYIERNVDDDRWLAYEHVGDIVGVPKLDLRALAEDTPFYRIGKSVKTIRNCMFMPNLDDESYQ